MNSDIRWQQRFSNFQQTLKLLSDSLQILHPSVTERAGTIQFFEMAFELAWKLLKDYLATLGYPVDSPRQTIKQALQSNLIENGSVWLEALTDRNITVHIYDEEQAIEIYEKIKNNFFSLLSSLESRFQSIIKNE